MLTDEIWIAEFRGFFWGEGCLDLTPFNRKGGNFTSYTPRIRIGVNRVDTPVLEEIQGVFGGSIFFQSRNDSATWQLTGKDKVGIALGCLRGGRVQAAKSAQVEVLQRALDLIPARGKNYTPEVREELMRCKAELEQLKRERRA
jgi:hypothetical protein